jgi:ketosteroid isomerase-like protein
VSQVNLETARQVLAAIARGNLDALLELTDPDVEWRSFFALSSSGEYRGHAGLTRYMADVQESFEMLEPVMDDAITSGDVVVGVGAISYRGKGSGVASEEAAGWLFKLRGSRVVLFRAFRDPAKGLESVGIGE